MNRWLLISLIPCVAAATLAMPLEALSAAPGIQVTAAYTLRTDLSGNRIGPADTFGTHEHRITCVVKLNGATEADNLQMCWRILEVGDRKDQILSASPEVPIGKDVPRMQGWLPNPEGMPPGKYAVGIVINGKEIQRVPFTIHPEPAARTVEYPWVAYVGQDRTPNVSGYCGRAWITVEQNRHNRFSVGFIEPLQGGVGTQTLATGWMTPLVSAGLMNANFGTLRFLHEVDSLGIDGPSAGGVTTVATLAALRGDTLRSDTVMTGMINPDGTIGPVGGIRYKMDGALAAGKKIFLLPAGGRTEPDLGTPDLRPVDVVAYGREKGLEVHEVGDVYEAYRRLTGKELPVLAGTEAPAIMDMAVHALIRTKMQQWDARYRETRQNFLNLPEPIRKELTPSLSAADRYASKARGLFDQGQPGAGWAATHRAAVLAEMALADGRIALTLNDHAKARAQVEAVIQAAGKLGGKRLDELCNFQAGTVGSMGALVTANAFWHQSAINLKLAQLRLVKADEASDALRRIVLTGKESDAERVQMEKAQQDQEHVRMMALTRAMREAVHARSFFDVVSDYLDLAGKIAGPALHEDAPMGPVSLMVHHASRANLRQFEALDLIPASNRQRDHIDSIRERFRLHESMYAQVSFELGDLFSVVARPEKASPAFDALLKAPRIEDQKRPGTGYDFSTPNAAIEAPNATVQKAMGHPAVFLGASLQGYINGAGLLAKYTSLGAIEDAEGAVTGYRMERSLTNMLELSDLQARRAINFLQDRKIDATSAIILYEAGRMTREGDHHDKFDALTNYWAAYVQARALASLVGVAK